MSNQGYKSERLEFSLLFEVSRKKFKTREEADRAVEEARRHFIRTGRSIAGVKIVARWRNPDNRKAVHANWKTSDDAGQSLFGFWKTITKRVGRA